MNSMQVHGAGLHRTTRLASRQPASARQLHPAHHSRAHRVIAFADNGISSGAAVCVRGLTFHPAGAEQPLLDDISLDLPALSMGLLIGRSGSGKTTLLNVLAGLCEQTSGSVHIIPRHAAPAHLSGPPSRNGNDGLPTSSSSSSSNGSSHNGQPAQNQPRGARFAARMAAENRPVQPVASKVTAPSNSSSSSLDGSAQNGTASSIVQQQPSSSSSSQLLLPPACSVEERMARVGLVFQFPERHFLGHNVLSELTFTWPPAMSQNALALADMNRRISMVGAV
jgi:energy-coupling factor transporter ATP-binding protein EcfA2